MKRVVITSWSWPRIQLMKREPRTLLDFHVSCLGHGSTRPAGFARGPPVVDHSANSTANHSVPASCHHHILATPPRPCMRTDA